MWMLITTSDDDNWLIPVFDIIAIKQISWDITILAKTKSFTNVKHFEVVKDPSLSNFPQKSVPETLT